MQSGRRIAFDYGDVRIGVAVSDPDGVLATPLKAIGNFNESLDAELITLLTEINPIYLVVGLPRHLSGAPSAKEKSVALFAARLRTLTQLAIYSVDERLTTVSASKTLHEAGKNSREAKSEIDAVAAAAILDSALNQERIHGAPISRLL